MPLIALFCILFGGIVIAFPEFLSYLIGFFFLFIGINSLIISLSMRRKSGGEGQSWKFGSYEILKRK